MVDFEPYFRALASRGAATACPVCGRFEWSGAGEYGLVHSYDEHNAVNVGRGYSVILVICGNCGFIRQHFTPVLESALSEERETPGQQPDDRYPK